MKYIVMECRPSYAIVLDEEGRFLRTANLRYEVGQTVEHVVLMREQKDLPVRLRVLAGAAGAAAACLALTLGAGYYQTYVRTYSHIYMSINPDVQMDLNRKGTVVGLSGMNADGQALLADYDGKGKDKTLVADELIDRALDMGFLTAGGQVAFLIDAPEEEIFEAYGIELRTQVGKQLEGSVPFDIVIMEYEGEMPEETPEAAPVFQEETAETVPAPVGPPETEAPQTPIAPPETETPPASAPLPAAETEVPPTAPPATEAPPASAAPSAAETEAAPSVPPAAEAPSASALPYSEDTDYGTDDVTDYRDGDTDYEPDWDDDTDYGGDDG